MFNFLLERMVNRMVAKSESSVFSTKTAKQRSDFMKENPGVTLSPVNFHMLFAIYKVACKSDPRYNEMVKRYTSKKKK